MGKLVIVWNVFCWYAWIMCEKVIKSFEKPGQSAGLACSGLGV